MRRIAMTTRGWQGPEGEHVIFSQNSLAVPFHPPPCAICSHHTLRAHAKRRTATREKYMNKKTGQLTARLTRPAKTATAKAGRRDGTGPGEEGTPARTPQAQLQIASSIRRVGGRCQTSGQTTTLSACTVCLDRPSHDIARCASEFTWDGEKACCRRMVPPEPEWTPDTRRPDITQTDSKGSMS
jgi:hypothetical protein